ncbi:hypothetical protein [Sunxiuqinia dokdonensis]|uniref:hypothetical protein n=1 Tax=Sunxiuqinia dokdonensis TaxID=1409788 RepID=UPI00069F68E1|nr:hypothetical protein [Sunxiuqinia dokdonensis]
MKKKHKIVSILPLFLFVFIVLLVKSNFDKKEYISSSPSTQHPTSSKDFDFPISNSSQHYDSLQDIHPLDRNEILEKNLKGYREQTYWGNEHPVDEKVRHLDNDEFKDFVEDEIVAKDIDVYWGEEY